MSTGTILGVWRRASFFGLGAVDIYRRFLHSVQQNLWVMAACWPWLSGFLPVAVSLRPHGLQPARLPWASPSPGVCSNSSSLTQGGHPTISPSVAPFMLGCKHRHRKSIRRSFHFPWTEAFQSALPPPASEEQLSLSLHLCDGYLLFPVKEL